MLKGLHVSPRSDVARIEAQLPVEQLGDIASAHPCSGLIHVRSTICSPSSDLSADTVVGLEPLGPLGLVVEAELGSDRAGVTVLELSHADAVMITATIKNTRLVTDFIVPGWRRPRPSRASRPTAPRAVDVEPPTPRRADPSWNGTYLAGPVCSGAPWNPGASSSGWLRFRGLALPEFSLSVSASRRGRR